MPSITPLPTPPSRNDPVNFSERADTFFGALPVFATEANELTAEVNGLRIQTSAAAATATAAASTATTKANNAEASANNALANAQNAAASNGATRWTSGTNYTAGTLVWSPVNGRNYRRLVTGSGTTDPSSDSTNWILLSVVVEQTDVGTEPNQVPLNQNLGEIAFQDKNQFTIAPQANVNPHIVGEMLFQLTNDTTLVIKVKGSDGVIRSSTITLA